MEKYNKDSVCKKCGYNVIDVKYGTTELIYDDDSRLTRTCQRCGYSWWEETL